MIWQDKLESVRLKWHKHYEEMKENDKSARLGDAMKEAKKTYKKSQNGGKSMVFHRKSDPGSLKIPVSRSVKNNGEHSLGIPLI